MLIEPIGRLLPLDAEGFLCRDTSADLVPDAWWPLVHGVIAVYREHCGDTLHSVYLRGSVPRGLAIPGVSDLDTLAVLKIDADSQEPPWTEAVSRSLHLQHGIGTGVEMTVSGMNHLTDPDLPLSRLLATQALCVHGPDLIDSVPRYRPDRSMVSHVPTLAQNIDQIAGWLADPEEDDAEVCRWIMKRIVRAGLEMHIEAAGVFTRDLWPCYEVFIAHSPERAQEMYSAMELAVVPIVDHAQILSFVDDFGRWLAAEAQRKLALGPPA
jgi:hypothetical protein